MTRRGMRVVRAVAVVAVLAAVGWAVYAFWPRPTDAGEWAAEYDLESTPPEDIAPGTVVGTSAPAGWSHLVIKSLPRVHPEYRGKLNALTVEKAAWMFTAFAVDVRPEEHAGRTRFAFRRVGLGLGGKDGDGRTVVVTPETAAKFGVKLDLITREILTRGYATQHKAVVVFHGPSFALLDTPVWARWGGKNRLVRYRYPLLVDTATGRLETLVWVLGPDGGLADEPEMGWLNPDTIDDAELIPDPDEIPGGLMPRSDAAFAVDHLPPTRERFVMPPELRGLAARTRFTPAEVRTLEAALRKRIAR